MKNFLLRLLIFITINSLCYLMSIDIWNEVRPADFKTNLNYRPAHGGHFFTRLREVELSSSKIDVLVVGSSHAYRSFDPRLFDSKGIKLFNLGSSAQTPVQTELLLNRYLERLNPKIVIMEIYPGSLSSDGIEAALDLVSNTPKIDKFIYKMVFDLNNLKLWNTFLLVKMNQWFHFYNIERESAVKGDDLYVNGGFVENKTVNKNDCRTKAEFEKLNEDQLEAIERIEQLVSKRNIKLFYVSAPVSQNYFNSYANYQSHLDLFKQKDNYYDFSQMSELNDINHFIDCDHLNQYGVNIFNEKLLNMPLFTNKQ